MKKNYILLLVSLITFFQFSEIKPFNSIKMSLVLGKNKDQWGTDIFNKGFSECESILENLIETQKKRKLTIEEMNLAYYAFIYIFSTQYQDYSGKIVISIDDKKTLNLPFSSEILINLISAILEEQNNQAK
jgi:hypothetical protein